MAITNQGALKHNLQKITHDDLLFRCANASAEGTLLTYAIEDGQPKVGFVEKVSGNPDPITQKVAGLLMINVEDRAIPSNLVQFGDDTGTVDLPQNRNRNVTNTSGVVRLLKVGMVETDQVDGAVTFAQGSGVYIGANGIVTTVDGTGATELVGHALTGVRDGYVRVFINVQ